MRFNTNISKRNLKRKQRDGSIKEQQRYVLHWRDPKTGKRKQQFFGRQKEAQTAQRELIVAFEEGKIYEEKRDVPTIAKAFDYWLANRKGEVKEVTYQGYESYRPVICGPLLDGTREQRFEHSYTGKMPKGCKLKNMLGDIRADQLTTADIRLWEKEVAEKVGDYTARKARQHLQTILSLAAEDFGIRPPAMPRRGRGKRKEKKQILTPEQIATLYRMMRQDQRYGLYIMWSFFMRTRPSEQLALHWEDIDFERNVAKIHRVLECNGTICDFTKTEAGMREVPIPSVLREWLLEWRVRCPRSNGELRLVFPSQGAKGQWPMKKFGGGVLLYSNFRHRIWVPAFAKAEAKGIPYVTPHAARHSYISALQAKGIEVGLVAKLAGHASPSIMLDVYTHSVRTGNEAVEVLSEAYAIA